MARGPRAVDVSVEARQFVELFGKASQVEPKLKTALRRNMRNAAKDIVKAVQAEVTKPPLSGGSSRSTRRSDEMGVGATPLRTAIARGIKQEIRTGANSKAVGVAIRASSSSLHGSRKKLVRRYDRGEWKHPVFGDKDIAWVSQKGRPYFGSVISKHKPQMRAAVQKAMDEAAASLTK